MEGDETIVEWQSLIYDWLSCNFSWTIPKKIIKFSIVMNDDDMKLFEQTSCFVRREKVIIEQYQTQIGFWDQSISFYLFRR